MSWTDERVETLKKMWGEGQSASQIAKELGGVTRNAVIGKVHRLGLSNRAGSSASSPAKPAAKEKAAKEIEAEKKLFLAWKGERKSAANALRTVPVVFHLIEDNPTITDQGVITALASLNNAFSHLRMMLRNRTIAALGLVAVI